MQGDRAVCACPKCEVIYSPVCGSDGLTYASSCYLKQVACQLRRNIYAGKDGACGTFLCIISPNLKLLTQNPGHNLRIKVVFLNIML